MAAVFAATHSKYGQDTSAPTPQGAEVVTVRTTLAVAAADLVSGSWAIVATLPARCVPRELEVDATDLDTSTAAQVFTLGIANRAGYAADGTNDGTTAVDTLQSTLAADGGGAWGVTTAANAAFDQKITRTGKNMKAVTPVDYDRHVIMFVTTAPTTAAAGTMGFTLSYAAVL